MFQIVSEFVYRCCKLVQFVLRNAVIYGRGVLKLQKLKVKTAQYYVYVFDSKKKYLKNSNFVVFESY